MNEVLDFKVLLKEIPGPNPAGADLRDDENSVYFQAKSAENQARRAERKIFEGEESGPPDWSYILTAVPGALATKSKDIELAALLTEALVRRHQFAGLCAGLKLTWLLIEAYWDKGLHPVPKDEDLTGRVRMLAALNGDSTHLGALIRPIQHVPLTEANRTPRAFGCWDYLEADRVAAIQDAAERERQIKQGVPTLEQLARAEQQTSAAFLAETRDSLAQCLRELEALTAVLSSRCRGCARLAEEETVALSKLADLLAAHLHPVAKLLWDRSPATQELFAEGPRADDEDWRAALAAALNQTLEAGPLHQERAFAGLTWSEEARRLLQEKPASYGLVRLNRILLEDALDLQRPALAPSTDLIKLSLEACRERLVHEQAAPAPTEAAATVDGRSPNGRRDETDPLMNRQDAFQQLLEIAKFFEATEPHSPISYSLRNIVRWGSLPLPDLLAELIQDRSARTEVFRRVGISEPPKPE